MPVPGLPLRRVPPLFLLLVLGVSFHTSPLVAQATPIHRDRFWFNVGVGVGGSISSGDEGRRAAVGVSATYQPGLALFTVRSTGIYEIFNGTLLGDVGVLAGVGTRGGSGHASIAIGPALAGGTVGIFRDRGTTFRSTLGLGVQAQAFPIAFQAIGLGVSGFANLNHRESFGGVMLSLTFGVMPR